MKSKYVMLVSTMLISVTTFAQEAEMKALKKTFDKEIYSDRDLSDFNQNIDKVKYKDTNLSDSDVLNYNFYKSFARLMQYKIEMQKSENKNNADFLFASDFNIESIGRMTFDMNAVLNSEKTSGTLIFTKKIQEEIIKLKPLLLNYAIALGDKTKYKDASLILKNIYDLDNKDTEKLYYAANYALNAKDYDLSLSDYLELKKINYTGEKTDYYAKSKINDKENLFQSKEDRDRAILIGTHDKPSEKKITSKKGEIYKNIALILRDKGKDKEAIKAYEDARIVSPDDGTLLSDEAALYYKIKDLGAYKKLINESLLKKPNDEILIFNLGVVSRYENQKQDAERYYRKAIELKPNYFDANLNLAELLLSYDTDFIKKMDSEKDDKKYLILKADREKMFKSAIPFLEKSHEIAPKNEDVTRTLISVYNALDMIDKAKALKSKM